MDYQDAFSNDLVPTAGLGYVSIVLTASQPTNWPYNYAGDGLVTAAIMDVACEVGNVLSLPPVDQVSVGEAVIVRNVGANALEVHDSNAVTLAVVAAGVAQLFWVKDNVYPGAWGQVTYGAGTAAATAGALAGFGTKATGATLSVAAPVLATTSSLSLTVGHRGQAIEFTGGAGSLNLAAASMYGNDFFCYIKNSGSGLITITPYAGGAIDNQSALGLQPSESLILLCTGSTDWFSVGYGRSILYQFSQLVLDVSAGGTFTLNSTQASNKMLTFVGNPAAAVSVVVPTTVSVYYVANNLSTAITVQVKTAGMPGANVGQTQRAVLLCDGTSVTAAQSVVVNSAVGILDGSEAAPSLNFSSKPNTGLYKYSTQGFGVSVNGVAQLYSNGGAAGVEVPFGITIGGVKLRTSATGSTVLAAGTTAQRDISPAIGWTRFNTTLGYNETWNGAAWAAEAPLASPTFTGTVTAPQNFNVTQPYGALQVNGVDKMRFGADNSGQLAGFRNKIINGDMRVNQRGPIVPSIGLQYVADRWAVYTEGAALSSAVVQPYHYYNHNMLVLTGAAGNTYSAVLQKIEGINTLGLDNKVCTLSVAVYSTDTRPVSIYVTSAGAKDYWAVTQSLITNVVQPATSGTREYSISFTCPNNINGLAVGVSFGAVGAGVQVGTTLWQLEEGSIATPFENRPIGLELALCQRYFARFAANGVSSTYLGGVGAFSSATGAAIMFQFPVVMRAAPTFAYANLMLANAIIGWPVTGLGASYIASHGAQIAMLASAGTFTAGQAAYTYSDGDGSGFVEFNAEL